MVFSVLLLFLSSGSASAQDIPDGLEAFSGEDGSVWVRVNQPGFGDANNWNIVTLTPYGDSLYAVTRNDSTGFELWKTSGTGWVRVTVPGFTDDNNYFGWLKPGEVLAPYDAKFNLKQNIWGDMIVFNGSLYVAVSSGYQGAQLYGSLGTEIWRFNGISWEAVVSQSVDTDESGIITSVSDCTDADTGYTAQLSDSTKTWAIDEWAGCVLRVTGEFDGSEGTDAGTLGIRSFEIVSNGTNTLTFQEHENANADQYTICAEHRIRRVGDFGRPDNVVPAMGTGDTYTIECGTDERGFGEMWNKSIVDLETLNGELYASIGLNYPDGARVWKTSNGTTWVPDSPYSFNLFHGFDPNGDPTGFCLVPGTEGRNGDPVSSSVTNLGKSNVTGALTLFTGGTGTSGCNGRGARVARLDGGTWNLIVDYFVDENDTGTNENGFGVAESFPTSNFQAWSWADYDGLLFVSVIRLKDGSRIIYTGSGSDLDGAWSYSMGGDATAPDGFGDATNIGSHLYVFDSELYAGTVSNAGFNNGATTNGADIWKGTGPGDSITWTRVTGNAFGDTSIAQFEAFTSFGGSLYVVGSNITASGFVGDEEPDYSGATVFRRESGPFDDYDGDGLANNTDNCPLIANAEQTDADLDGRGDVCDNCPEIANGPDQGTCVQAVSGVNISTGVPCTADTYCATGETCQQNQEDINSNVCGDVCECYSDITGTSSVPDGKVNLSDLVVMKDEFLQPCPPSSCTADLNGDGKVDLSDLVIMKIEFLASGCPACL